MTKTIESKKARNGSTYKLQARGSKFDVIYCTGYCWKYALKAVSEQAARNEFDLVTL